MSFSSSARQVLRRETADAHARVDRAFSRFVLDERLGYTGFLQAQADAFLPLEGAIDAADPGDVVPDWAQRRRGHLLRDDLVALGAAPNPPTRCTALGGTAELLGTIYVLEGSRLGGTLLARTVPGDFPQTFLGSADSRLWRSLIERLESGLAAEADRRRAVHAAQSAFDLFERSALRHLEGASLD